jgi:hypothetical protein
MTLINVSSKQEFCFHYSLVNCMQGTNGPNRLDCLFLVGQAFLAKSNVYGKVWWALVG